jgi:hypothetical protein
MRRSLLVVVVALAGVVATVAPSHAAINRPVAVWQMNEPAGSRTMLDSSGNGINGVIGTDVLAGTALTGGGTGYRFTFIRPNQPPANPQRLVQVPHNARLNPGTGDFAVEVRLRTTHLRQRDPEGAVRLRRRLLQAAAAEREDLLPVPRLGGKQHGVLGHDPGQRRAVAHGPLERTSASVVMTVDGVVTGRNRNPTGSIANTRPITIAGKLNCDQVQTTCDYFAGDLDYVKIETS